MSNSQRHRVVKAIRAAREKIEHEKKNPSCPNQRELAEIHRTLNDADLPTDIMCDYSLEAAVRNYFSRERRKLLVRDDFEHRAAVDLNYRTESRIVVELRAISDECPHERTACKHEVSRCMDCGAAL